MIFEALNFASGQLPSCCLLSAVAVEDRSGNWEGGRPDYHSFAVACKLSKYSELPALQGGRRNVSLVECTTVVQPDDQVLGRALSGKMG